MNFFVWVIKCLWFCVHFLVISSTNYFTIYIVESCPSVHLLHIALQSYSEFLHHLIMSSIMTLTHLMNFAVSYSTQINLSSHYNYIVDPCSAIILFFAFVLARSFSFSFHVWNLWFALIWEVEQICFFIHSWINWWKDHLDPAFVFWTLVSIDPVLSLFNWWFIDFLR